MDSSLGVVKAEDGDFYLGVRGVNAFLIANGKTQGGLRRLTKVSSAVPLNRLSSRGGLEYYRSGLSFGKDAIFAVYDKDTDAYYKIRVLKVIRTSIPDLVGIPTITSPKNDAAPSTLCHRNYTPRCSGLYTTQRTCRVACQNMRYSYSRLLRLKPV
jgi:hypothetical protein